MRRLSLFLALPLVLASTTAVLADYEDGYFPVADGNEWVYQPNDGGAQVRVHIDQRTVYQGSVYYRLRGYNGDLHWVTQPADGDVRNVNRRWYRLDAPLGTPWSFQVNQDSIPGSNASRLTVVRRERVRTPAGLFDDCLRVRWESFGSDGITEEWFARGIGLVQRRVMRGGQRVDLELVSATISGQQVVGASQPAPPPPPPVAPAQGAFGIAGQVPASRVDVRVILAQAMDRPTGMAFKPADGSLWIVDRERDATLVIHDPGQTTMRGRIHFDDSDHFNNNPMAIAFSRTRDEHATALQNRNDYNGAGPPNDFMGPTLWTSDEAIFQGGHMSHLDMLHHSPMAVGIAAGLPRDPASDPREYWVFNGDAGTIDRYFFRQPHELGGHDHEDGLTFRYGSGLSTVVGVPGHLALDVATGILYAADTGNGRIVKLDPSETSINTAQRIQGHHDETPLYRIPGSSFETVTAAGLSQPAGLILSGGRLVVSDHGTGHVLVFGLDGTLEGDADTGLGPNVLTGLAETPDGRLFALDGDQGRVLELTIR